MADLAGSTTLLGRAGQRRRCGSRVDTTDPERGALHAAGRGAVDRDRAPGCCSSSSSGPRSPTTASTSCSPTSGSRSAATTSRRPRRYRPHLLTEPEEMILAEKYVTGAERVGPPVRRADLGDHGRPRRRRASALEQGALASAVARPRRARGRGRGGHRGPRARACAPAPSCSTRCSPTSPPTTACATTRLDREPQPRQRGERRVGAGAGRRGASPLRHPAALVRAEGAAARHRPARRLRPHGVGRRRPSAEFGWTEAQRARARRLRVVLARAGRRRPTRFFDEPWIDAPVRPGKRGGRVLRVHRARRTTRTCC